jgi:hypothetical protein
MEPDPTSLHGPRGSVVEALCYKPEGRGFPIRSLDFSVDRILPAAV